MRFSKFWLSLVMFVVALGAQAQAPSFQEGSDYVVLERPQPTEAPRGGVDVVEFFSYHCPHCAALEPKIGPWASSLPKDVYFHRSPVVFQQGWVQGARLFLALQATRQLDKFHAAVFKAVHEQHLPILTDSKALSDWMVANGGDATNLNVAMHSFSSENQVTRAQALAAAYEISGVPTLAVAGRYVPAPGFHGDALALTNFLIAKARAEQKQRAK